MNWKGKILGGALFSINGAVLGTLICYDTKEKEKN